MNAKRKVALLILDGWGIAEDPSVSAIDTAQTPFYDSIRARYPFTRLRASEGWVGLPAGQMGNSEVGHMHLGAGRVIYQELVRVTNTIRDGGLAQLKAWTDTVAYCQANNKPLHLIGLVSDGGVHSHIDHLLGLLDAAQKAGIAQAYVHVITDGRDTAPDSGRRFLMQLEAHLAASGYGRIATVCGRYYAMDRDKRWERTHLAWDLLVKGNGEAFPTAMAALEASYTAGVTDEFVKPAVIGTPVTIAEGDAVLFFNFRTDRGRQLTSALSQKAYSEQQMHPLKLHYVTMTRYDETFQGVDVLFEKDDISNTLGQVLAENGCTQIRIAETEKYPHVTFFFNGGREEPFPGERRILCPSPKVATYDLQPQMSAFDIRNAILPEVKAGTADFICLNFANPDMVGHTGVFEAAVKACETVDQCAQAVVEAGLDHYTFIILADHGNADRMRNPDGTPHTAHTLAEVPCILIPRKGDSTHFTLSPGALGDIAPTILHLMGLPVPSQMTGKVLVAES